MSLAILGRKVGMTQVFDENANAIPVTVVEAGPCPIVQKKTMKTDKYNAIQVGFLDKKRQRVRKPNLGHFDKAKVAPKRYLREIRMTDEEIQKFDVGQDVKADIFAKGEFVDVIGTTKGRGFTGVFKRHNFHGVSTDTHGSHEYFRHGGSIGSATMPGRVFKGKKMPGHYGNDRVTIQNLQIVEVRPEQNILLIKGAVPGANNGLLIIKQAEKKKNKKK